MAKSKLSPIGGNVLIKPVSVEKISNTGIVLPNTVDKEKPQRGEIIALGTGKRDSKGKLIEFSVKVGDMVVFEKYSPKEIDVDGEKYLIVDESSILCVIN